MNLGRLVLATVAAMSAMAILAGLWHTWIMAEFYAENTTVAREQPLVGFLLLGHFVLALLMSYVYPRGASGRSPVSEGARFGAVMGLIYVLPHGLILHAVQGTSTATLLLVDAIWHVVEQGVGGVVIGLVYGSGVAPSDSGAQGESR